MSRKYFGTDGVRGRVGKDPMTVDFALKLASAAARELLADGGTVVIGKDTRVSGYMFESALEAGFVAAGANVLLLGPLPTPGIAQLTRQFNADLGVVISASHNPYFDNGIKFFNATGGKLSDDCENRIEAALEQKVITRDPMHLGKAEHIATARIRYQEFCKSSIPDDMNLTGLKIVIDCAHGAGYKVAPRVLADLGAEIIPIGCSPNGRNINDGCGSTHPELLQTTVTGVGADIGIALDGDGDRVVMVDANGQIVDGDQILYIIATARHAAGELNGPVIGTVMSNLGLELALKEKGIAFSRAKVGDRYVMELLREHDGTLGGETSGHIICLDRTTTGDGLVSALQVLSVIKQSGRTLSQLAAGMPHYPQTMINVDIEKHLDLDSCDAVQAAVSEVEAQLKDRGRVVLRPSGTEPVIRVMVEGEDQPLVATLAEKIADAVRAAAS